MSGWRALARRAVELEAGGALAAPSVTLSQSCADADAEAEALAEREAIAIIDGGLPPSWASALAMIERSPKPDGIPADVWRARLDMVWRRAAEHGAEFAANGWAFEEVFGVGSNWWRLDQRGVAWGDPLASIATVTPSEIVLTIGRQRHIHRRAH